MDTDGETRKSGMFIDSKKEGHSTAYYIIHIPQFYYIKMCERERERERKRFCAVVRERGGSVYAPYSTSKSA